MKYHDRGVSSSKEDVHIAIKDLDKGLFPNAFCKILPDHLGGDPAYCNIMHADGAGTKSSLAYMYWKETGDVSVWEGIAQDALVMNLDDILCAGVIDNMLVSSTIGRNKRRIPGEVIAAIINGTEAFIQKMRKHGINMVLSGGETADVGDLVKTIIIDSSVTTRALRTDIIRNSIDPGDVIIGLASFGQTSYEECYNSGIGSNGLTLARHDVFHKMYAEKYPESYDNELDTEVVYTGSAALTDPFPNMQTHVGKILLSPTRTYAPVLKMIFKKPRQNIKAMIHCTGGGQTKVLHFLKSNVHVVKDQLFETPPLFMFIHQQSGTPWREMYRVFNMGHRLEIYVAERFANEIIAICNDYRLDAKIVGRVLASDKKRLTISGEHGTYEYS